MGTLDGRRELGARLERRHGMRWIAAARERLAALFYRTRQDAELNEELAFHLENEARLLRDAGLDPKEAWREAQRRLGGVQQCKEGVRDARGLETLAAACRAAGKRPVVAIGGVTLSDAPALWNAGAAAAAVISEIERSTDVAALVRAWQTQPRPG